MNNERKKTAIGLLLVVFISVVYPAQKVYADAASDAAFAAVFNTTFFMGCQPCAAIKNFIGGIQGMAGYIASGMINFVVTWSSSIAATLLSISQDLLNWVISDEFIGATVTGPDNPFVSAGWGTVRDLANIILVLGLVIIALGIILGLQEYQAKKTLPVLIVIAMLINFTPVICGLIIDFSNILMKYFLTGGISREINDSVQEGLTRMLQKDAVEALPYSIVYFVFGIVAFFTYLFYFLLFAIRYLFLWILVIFSPIAFVSRIFPQSSKYIKHFFPEFFYWDTWWERFLMWCVIGIYGGFFIYLANKLIGLMGLNAAGAANNAANATSSASITAYGNLFGYLLPIILLLIGFFSAQEARKKGMAAIPGMEKIGELGKTAAMLAVTAGAGAALGAGKFLAKGAGEAIVGAGAGLAEGKGVEGRLKGMMRGGLSAAGREEGITAVRKQLEAVPGVGRLVGGPGAAELKHQEKLGKATKSLESIPDNPTGNADLLRMVNMAPVTEEDHFNRLAAMKILGQRGELPEDVLQKHLTTFNKSGMDKMDILKANPTLAPHFQVKDDATGQMRQMTIQEAIDKTSPEDFAKAIKKQAFKLKEIQKGMSSQQVKEIKEYNKLREEALLYAALDESKLKKMRNAKPEIRKKFKDGLMATQDPAYSAGTYNNLNFNQRKRIDIVLNRMSRDPNWSSL